MKPIPDVDNVEAMAAWGRRSALMSARKEAAEALRDASTFVQSADMTEVAKPAQDAIKAAERLIEIAGIWEQLK